MIKTKNQQEYRKTFTPFLAKCQHTSRRIYTFSMKALLEFWGSIFSAIGFLLVTVIACLCRAIAKFVHIKFKELGEAITFFVVMPPYLVFWSCVGFLAILLMVTGTIRGAQIAWGILNV